MDVRRQGSGNIGATNVLRAAGWGPAVTTLGLDVLKGYAAVWIGTRVDPAPHWAAAAAALAVVGNCWPVYLRFRGGKGVATGLGGFLRATPWAVLAAAVVFAVLLASFRFVSLASVCAVLGLPLAILALGYPWPLAVAGAVVAAIVVARHRENIARLLAGTESRVGRRKTPAAARPGATGGGR